jgi:hypothetical protein
MPTNLAQYINPKNKKSIKGESYQYPENLISDYVDFVEIKTYKYISLSEYFVTQNVIPITTLASSNGLVNAPKLFGEDIGGRGTAVERFIQGDIINTFKLPMPDQIQFDDNPVWNLEDTRTIGRFAPTVAQQFVQGGNQQNTAETLATMAKAGIPETILGIVESLGFFSSGQAITQGFNGKILNPYYEQIFKGNEPRSFNCRYKLLPRNEKEQTQIKNIIKALRINALPDYSRSGLLTDADPTVNNQLLGLGDRWLTVPNIFDLKFKSSNGEMSNLPKLKPLVLVSVSTNYTPDSVWSTHINEDGEVSPVAMELTLSFYETEIITAKEVEVEGY